jgi:hypothetical protein
VSERLREHPIDHGLESVREARATHTVFFTRSIPATAPNLPSKRITDASIWMLSPSRRTQEPGPALKRTRPKFEQQARRWFSDGSFPETHPENPPGIRRVDA